MIPNMYKIAGELTPAVFHVAARSLATQGLSIFGDHSDVMATRATGYAMLASNSVQEAQDLALIAHASTLKSRIPFMHFFDGFRTSHEVDKIEQLTREDIRAIIDDSLVHTHRQRALSPDHPFIRGTSQNPDVYFQSRETVNRFYVACPTIVQEVMDTFASLVGRQYHLFDYVGAPDAERVIVVMGSGAETVASTVKYLTAQGEKVGVLKVRLFRPFSVGHFLQAILKTVNAIAVLDRTKEPGSTGEPLYLDVVEAVNEGNAFGIALSPRIIGGRYGIGSKEFTPGMAKAIFDEMGKAEPKNHFTIGINDDVTHTSLEYDPTFSIERQDTVQCVFWGLGSDGTVGANKNSIKIIGEETDNYAQGYFVYDSKKSGSVTISHLRFGPHLISAPYLIGENQADFVACHQFTLMERFDVLKFAKPGSVFLLDSIYDPENVWKHLPQEVQQEYATELLSQCTDILGAELVNALLHTDQSTQAGINAQRERVALLKQRLQNLSSSEEAASQDGRVQNLLSLVDALVRKSVWIIGGDGWAYDIGYGGLDHVLASGRNVNVLVLDTEVYSNTGGQASKATPRAAVAKFAARGKATRKKNLGLLAMSYGNVYVASVAMGASDLQTLRAFLEAEAYDGPSLIIAYSTCIAHGFEMSKGLEQEKLAVQAGHWPLYRYHPALVDEGKNPFLLDSKAPTIPLEQYAYNETRYRMLLQSDEERANVLLKQAKQDVRERWQQYEHLAASFQHESEK